jgi:hypothetical protein
MNPSTKYPAHLSLLATDDQIDTLYRLSDTFTVTNQVLLDKAVLFQLLEASLLDHGDPLPDQFTWEHLDTLTYITTVTGDCTEVRYFWRGVLEFTCVVVALPA